MLCSSKQKYFFQTLLKKVSRSFYLSLRFLPASIRDPLSFGYLFARLTDTIADTVDIPIVRRTLLLEKIHHLFLAQRKNFFEDIANDLNENFISLQKDTSEKELLKNFSELMHYLKNFSAQEKKLLEKVLITIIEGQLWDLKFFSNSDTICIVDSDSTLENYIYRVAGCVGQFWTELCQLHFQPYFLNNDIDYLSKGINFGKGLQLVNILRDMKHDLALYRCYIPIHSDKPINHENLLLYKKSLEIYRMRALSYLKDGFVYCQNIKSLRIRWACYLPILMGIETLKLMENFSFLEHSHPLKIKRIQVYKIMLESIKFCVFKSSADKFLLRKFSLTLGA